MGRKATFGVEIKKHAGTTVLFDAVVEQNYVGAFNAFPAGLYFITIVQDNNILTKNSLEQ
jgi:hypothetical protein